MPIYAPARLSDRYTLWNEVEQVERNYNAQLAYSFDIALQNKFSLEENISLAREFIKRYFASDCILIKTRTGFHLFVKFGSFVYCPNKTSGIGNNNI